MKLFFLQVAFLATILVGCTMDNEAVDLIGDEFQSLSSKSVELPIYGINSDTEQHKDSYIDLAVDDDEDSKWLAYGSEVNVDLDIGGVHKVDYLKISFYEGDDKAFKFKVYSYDGDTYTQIGSKTSSGTNTEMQIYDVTNAETQYIRIQFLGNDVDLSNGVYDIEVWGTILEQEKDGYGAPTVEYGTISWKNWYLSLPIDRVDGSGKATSIYYTEIESNDLTDEQRTYFDFNTDGSFKMNAKFTGYITSGYYESFSSKYCRTELREYWQGNQTTSDNWYMNEGTHILESTLSVEKCEGEGKVYVAQIHGISGASYDGITDLTASPATIKVQWYEDNIILEHYTTEGIVNGEWTSASGTVGKVTLGAVANNKFTVRLKVEEGKFYMALYCEATGVDTGYVEYYDYNTNGYNYANYFKTGNYFRHDEDYTSFSEVTLYSAITSHE